MKRMEKGAMDNPGIASELWTELRGRLWHATNYEGLEGIWQTQIIKVSLSKRYKNSFCRCNGGVCLFDFGPTATDKWNQLSNWSEWLGSYEQRIAIWIEIDRSAVLSNLWDAETTHRYWQSDVGKRLIPGVEACHVGNIPASAVLRVLLFDYHDQVRLQSIVGFSHGVLSDYAAFQFALPEPPPINPFIAALHKARLAKRGQLKED